MHIIMPMHYVAKIEIEPFPPSGPPNFQNVVAPMVGVHMLLGWVDDPCPSLIIVGLTVKMFNNANTCSATDNQST